MEIPLDILLKYDEQILFDKRDLSELTDCERAYRLTYVFSIEANNGGLHQFLYNHSGRYANETVSAICTVVSQSASRLLEEAIGLFPERHIPEDETLRRKLLSKIDLQVLKTLDDEYFKMVELFESSKEDYVKEHFQMDLLKIMLPAIVEKAEESFRAKNYSDYLDALAPFKSILPSASARKYEFALKNGSD